MSAGLAAAFVVTLGGEIWKIRLGDGECPAVEHWLACEPVRIGDLLRDPDHRDRRLTLHVLIVLLQWLLHERYRRQIIFLPSFSRSRSGSSLSRAEAARAGEPSTVDAPARGPGSSVERRL